MMNREARGTDTKARDELVDLVTQELRGIREKLSEIKIQVDQVQLVVDREQHRNADITAELRTIQDNIETVPRQDIRAKYDEALDARFKLITMRGQLEKLQSIREQLERDQKLFGSLLNRLQGVDAIAAGTPDTKEGGGKTPINIVRIVQAQEEERQRLARQLHDGPAQSLTNFILQAEICQRLFDRNPQRAAEELNTLKTVAGVTFQKVRDFIFDLRPMILDDLGVFPTVRRYVDSFREKNDIQVSLEMTGEERRLESHREVMIFRGIQELIVNARDFASASNIEVRLDMGSDRVRIEVEDDGRGFDVQGAFSTEENVQDARIQSLIALRDRFKLVGGTMDVVSGEDQSTRVRLELPTDDT